MSRGRLQECPVCEGNGYVAIVPSRGRRFRPKSRPRPASKQQDPVTTVWAGERLSANVDWSAPHMVDALVCLFLQVCDPNGPLGPISEDERRAVVQRLYGYAGEAERHGLPQSEWRKLNLCASDIITWYKGASP